MLEKKESKLKGETDILMIGTMHLFDTLKMINFIIMEQVTSCSLILMMVEVQVIPKVREL